MLIAVLYLVGQIPPKKSPGPAVSSRAKVICRPRNACYPGCPLGGRRKKCPQEQKNGSYKASSLFLSSHTFGCVGVRCQWSMRPNILALKSFVSGQLEDWQGSPASHGFLVGSPGLFCLFPKLLTFGNRPDKQTFQLHL